MLFACAHFVAHLVMYEMKSKYRGAEGPKRRKVVRLPSSHDFEQLWRERGGGDAEPSKLWHETQNKHMCIRMLLKQEIILTQRMLLACVQWDASDHNIQRRDDFKACVQTKCEFNTL